MSPADPRTRTCTPEVGIGRMRKAEQFAEAFHVVIEFADIAPTFRSRTQGRLLALVLLHPEQEGPSATSHVSSRFR